MYYLWYSNIFCFCIFREKVRNKYGMMIEYIKVDWGIGVDKRWGWKGKEGYKVIERFWFWSGGL